MNKIANQFNLINAGCQHHRQILDQNQLAHSACKYNRSLYLPKIFGLEQKEYLIPAVLQTLINYYTYRFCAAPSQNELFELLSKDRNEFDYQLLPILRQYIRTVRYGMSYMPYRFGKSGSQIKLFQQAVATNLILGMPILLTFDGITPYSQMPRNHAIIIYGVKICDDDPQHSIYLFADPETLNSYLIMGSDLSNLYCAGSGAFFSATSGWNFVYSKLLLAELTHKWFMLMNEV